MPQLPAEAGCCWCALVDTHADRHRAWKPEQRVAMSQAAIDPIEYGRLRAREAHIAVPDISEQAYTYEALGALFSLVADCPMFVSLKPLRRRGFTRVFINACLEQINTQGFIPAAKNWSKLGNVLAHSFTKSESDARVYLTYEISGLESSPFFLAILGLVRLPEGSPLFFNTVRWLLTLHMFLSKLPLSRPDLTDPSETDWIDRQSRVFHSENFHHDDIEGLRVAVSWLYNDGFPDKYNLLGNHGPGATSIKGATTVPTKEAAFVPSIQTQSIAARRYNLGTEPTDVSPEQRKARLEMVVKDMGSMRPITLEPPEVQYAQQAIKRVLYRTIDNGLVNASAFIKFADQTLSQRLALKGSKLDISDASPITIDLSSASDLLSLDLVSSVFVGELGEMIIASRSHEVETGKGVVKTSMFGGMGSAVTFPVQTLVFTGIALMGVLASYYTREFGFFPGYAECVREYLSQINPWRTPALRKYLKNVRVYGDDIIIPAMATDHVLGLLTRLGLKVNIDKSFFADAAVREACGIYALAGADITPVRYRVPVYNTTGFADFAVLEGFRSLSNRAFCECFTNLYRYCVRVLRGLVPFERGSDAKKKTFQANGRRAHAYSFRADHDTDKKHTCYELRNSETLKLDQPHMLFEEWRGDDADYIGVLSTRDPLAKCTSQTLFGTRRLVQTWYNGETYGERDELSDDYHFVQALYQGLHSENLPSAHGSLPRGIRLRRRIAYFERSKNGWAWAPSAT